MKKILAAVICILVSCIGLPLWETGKSDVTGCNEAKCTGQNVACTIEEKDTAESALTDLSEPLSKTEAVTGSYEFIFPKDLFSEGLLYEEEVAPFGFVTRKYKYAGLTVAESFGMKHDGRVEDIEDFFADIDGDGYAELLCNVIFGGDGHRELYVYKAASDAILLGTFSRAWLPEDWNNWGSNAVETWYDEAAGDILVRINRLQEGPTDLHCGFETVQYTEYVKYESNGEGIRVF